MSTSSAPLSTSSTVEILPKDAKKKKNAVRTRRHIFKVVCAALPVLVLLAVIITIIIILLPSNSNHPTETKCKPSLEAQRVGLHSFFEKLENSFFQLHPELIPTKPRVTPDEVRQGYRPYDPRPSAIKNYTDETAKLRGELFALMAKTDETKLKLKERKVAHLAMSYLLRYSFQWGPYERDYYAGDWMLEPNMYCWQPICDVINCLYSAIESFKPVDLEGVQRLRELFARHNSTILQYVENLKMGVTRGMVRSRHSCAAGLHALKRNYRSVALNNETGILENFADIIDPNTKFLEQITPDMNSSWIKKHGQGVRQSLKRYLVNLLGRPLVTLMRYMEFEHMRHCVSDSKVSGLHSLPLPFVYVDDVIDNSRPTLQTLPTGELLNGSQSYLRLFTFFSKNDVTPEQLRTMGYEKLDELLKQVKDIAKKYTKEEDESTAVIKFREVLESRDMFYNSEPFPANESDENAFMKCGDNDRAQRFCPKRWEAFQRWSESIVPISESIQTKIKNFFYYSGAKITAPKCKIGVEPEFNPDVCFHGYAVGYNCFSLAKEILPFFMDNFGPKYTGYTTTAHEQLPGHHLEVQGFTEHFSDKCDGSISFFSNPNYVPAFTEGWATYVEHPLISRDTDIYSNVNDKEVLLRKYGMYKYQILAALRSVLDTGVNYFGMKRSEAAKLFDKYAWDKSDLVTKDITRFQSAPGTVTSYMVSQASFRKIRELAEKELGSNFSFPEFHYQVLRQGEVPLDYLEQYIGNYIECSKDSSRAGCSEILN